MGSPGYQILYHSAAGHMDTCCSHVEVLKMDHKRTIGVINITVNVS